MIMILGSHAEEAMLGKIAKLAIIFALAIIGYAVLRSGNLLGLSGTYEDCVINEMRGQSIFMEQTVRQACARRFGLPQR